MAPRHQHRGHFRGDNGDQAQQGSVIVRTRDHASETRSGVGAGGGAVALMVELLSVYSTLPESAPLSSYRCGNEVRLWSYPEPSRHFARRHRRQEMISVKSDFYSLRIGEATMLANVGEVSQYVHINSLKSTPRTAARSYVAAATSSKQTPRFQQYDATGQPLDQRQHKSVVVV